MAACSDVGRRIAQGGSYVLTVGCWPYSHETRRLLSSVIGGGLHQVPRPRKVVASGSTYVTFFHASAPTEWSNLSVFFPGMAVYPQTIASRWDARHSFLPSTLYPERPITPVNGILEKAWLSAPLTSSSTPPHTGAMDFKLVYNDVAFMWSSPARGLEV